MRLIMSHDANGILMPPLPLLSSDMRELTFSQAVILVSESDFTLLPLMKQNAA